MADTREQLVEYFTGERRSFDLPIARRVIGVEGSLKGYADGMSLKERLLNFEASQKPLFA
jgi:O6-methylguanine-DNA--protein-cysteine methyltransferase